MKNQSDNGSKTVVLIVEDDYTLANMYAEKFKNDGYEVLLARDGESGFKTATEQKPNIILLDMVLPKYHGLSLLTKLRSHPTGKNIPVIALTNYAEQPDKKRAQELGVKNYLIKAMQSPEQVVECVKASL